VTCSVYLTNAANSRRCALQSMDGTNAVRGPIFVGPIAAGETNNGLPQLMAMNAGSEFKVYSQVGDLDSGNRYAGSFYLRGTTGSGKLYGTINLPSATLVKTDANGSWTIYSTGNAAATTFIAQGLVRLGVDNGLPNAPLVMGQAASTGILDLAGFNQQVTTLNDIAGINIIANSSTTTDSLLTLSGGGLYAGSLQNSISNGTRTVGLTLLSGAQQFSGPLTYSGPTTINGGGIALIGNGSMSNTISIHIANGSAIDVSLRSDGTLSLGAAQTLKGNGTFNITGNLVSQGTLEFKVDKTAGTVVTDKLGVTGQLTYGGKLKLVPSGEALTASDTLPLFSAGAFGTSSFAVIEPAQPGSGLTWDTTTLATDGTLRIASAGLSIGTAYIASGSKIVLNASGGTPNAGFTILTSTNVANPVAAWDVDQTGNLDASGNISVTNVINLGERQRYFIFRIP
jgi:autotransporter-associated beta strand protein